jgi:prepilin signal peptidase PulO-like enzyme (type II secretory pathway)
MFSWNQCWIVSLIGLFAGAAVNWGIYNLAWTKKQISPWGKLPQTISKRPLLARIPVIGWWCLRLEATLHGKHFWFRPACIELGTAAVFALFYYHHTELMELISVAPNMPSNLLWLQLIPHLILVVLLITATFIDLDERLIPDTITVTGTLLALGIAAVFPESRLIDLGNPLADIVFLKPSSPAPPQIVLESPAALIWASGCLLFWGFAIIPKITTARYGLSKGVQVMLASMIRPGRKSRKPDAPRKRKPFASTLVIAVSMVIGLVGIFLCWRSGAVHWASLNNAIWGMTGGLLVVWGVRIVARFALQREAMGFGDVTLLAMIGAFLGWQAALLTFVLAPFAGLLLTIAQFISTRKSDLAFGPYLSLSAIIVILGWPLIWTSYARNIIFIHGSALPIVLLIGLAAMWALLFVWQQIKNSVAN